MGNLGFGSTKAVDDRAIREKEILYNLRRAVGSTDIVRRMSLTYAIGQMQFLLIRTLPSKKRDLMAANGTAKLALDAIKNGDDATKYTQDALKYFLEYMAW